MAERLALATRSAGWVRVASGPSRRRRLRERSLLTHDRRPARIEDQDRVNLFARGFQPKL